MSDKKSHPCKACADNVSTLTPTETQPQSDFGATVYVEVWNLWLKHKRTIVYAVGAIMTVIVAYHLFLGVKAWREYTVQKAFVKAETREQRVTFFKHYPKTHLGGVMGLLLGREALNQNDATAAAQYYLTAEKALKNITLLEVRAKLGYATALLANHQNEASAQQLEHIAASKKYGDLARAEATYLLALIAYDKKDYARCQTYIDSIKDFPLAAFYKDKAAFLKRMLPKK